jgi:hypothetical protein
MQPCCCGKAVSITYSEWVSVCSLSYPACKTHVLCCIDICSLSVVQHFCTLSHKWHDFRKKVIEHKMCVLIFCMFVWNISHSKKNLAIKISGMYMGIHVKYPLFSSDFDELEFSWQIFEKFSNQISWKSVQWEPSCSMWADGWMDKQTDTMKLIVAFRNFANAHKNATWQDRQWLFCELQCAEIICLVCIYHINCFFSMFIKTELSVILYLNMKVQRKHCALKEMFTSLSKLENLCAGNNYTR